MGKTGRFMTLQRSKKEPGIYVLGGASPVPVKDIGEWGDDAATAERELEAAYAKQLAANGHAVRRQVRTEAGVADIVTDDAVIEVKLHLTRSALFGAVGQVTAYAACLGRPRRVVFGYGVEGTDAVIAALEASGVEVVAWAVPDGMSAWSDDECDACV